MKAARTSGYLRDVIWNKYLRIESKAKIYKTKVRIVVTYAAETRADNSKIKQLVRTTKMDTFREMVGKTIRGRIRKKKP